jgi:pimeloyl-ACP methyl ester carboxylesterase
LVGVLYRPIGKGPCPSVVLLGGSGGDTPESVAALLASHGYAALALAYFGKGNLPEHLTSIPLEYFQRAFRWLQSQEGIRNQGVAVMGWSRGGELALLLGATFPEVNAVVSYVGSGVVHSGFVASPVEAENPPAWTYQGKPLSPYISFDPHEVDQSRSLIRETPGFLRSLADVELVEAATIPVERINGSVLLISGRDDQVWPSALMKELGMASSSRIGQRPPISISIPSMGSPMRSGAARKMMPLPAGTPGRKPLPSWQKVLKLSEHWIAKEEGAILRSKEEWFLWGCLSFGLLSSCYCLRLRERERG